jgi:hypothetical protein
MEAPQSGHFGTAAAPGGRLPPYGKPAEQPEEAWPWFNLSPLNVVIGRERNGQHGGTLSGFFGHRNPATSVVLVAALLFVAGLASVLSGISSASSVTASSLLASMSRALGSEHSVRWESQLTEVSPCGIGSSTDREDSIADAADSSGRFELVMQDQGQKGQEAIIDDDGIVYLYANAFALQRFNCFSSKLVKAIADRWSFALPSNPNYSALVSELTMPSIVKGLSWHSAKLLPKLATVFGQRAYELQTSLSGYGVHYTLDLYVRAAGAALPIEEVTISRVAVSTQVFTDWGEQFEVSQPHGAVSIP